MEYLVQLPDADMVILNCLVNETAVQSVSQHDC